MKQAAVTEAVHTLKAQGTRVSVRTIHAMLGGSFRDISKMLRGAEVSAEPLADDDAGDRAVETAAPAPAPVPAQGRIMLAHQAVHAAEQATNDAATALDAARAQLLALLPQRPQPDADPHRAQLRAQAAQQQRRYDAARADLLALRVEDSRLRARALELRRSVIPSARRDAAEATHRLGIVEQEAAFQIAAATHQVQRTARAIAAAEAELAALIGE
jgi:hypothetical protein